MMSKSQIFPPCTGNLGMETRVVFVKMVEVFALCIKTDESNGFFHIVEVLFAGMINAEHQGEMVDAVQNDG